MAAGEASGLGWLDFLSPRMVFHSHHRGFGWNLSDLVPGICAIALVLCRGPRSPVARASLALARENLSNRESHRIAAGQRHLARELLPKPAGLGL